MLPQTIAVTGANGFVGTRVLAHLKAAGATAMGIVRSGRTLSVPDCTTREVDSWSESALARALTGVEAVVHAASVVHRPSAGIDEHRRFNVDGTRSLLAAMQTSGVRRVLFLSTIKVYGEEPAGTIDERTTPDRSSPYAATKLEAEEILLDSSRNGGPSAIVFRLCPVYGAGDKGNVRRIATAMARRRFVVPGDGSTRKSVVHASLVARAVERALSCPASGTFVIADREAPSIRELSDTIARTLGRRPPPRAPIPAVMAAAAAAAAWAWLRRREPSATPELIQKSLRSTVCSPALFERTFGMECRMPLEDGIAEEVAWLRREGLL
jgi:UDP-glucose 4-epimerase